MRLEQLSTKPIPDEISEALAALDPQTLASLSNYDVAFRFPEEQYDYVFGNIARSGLLPILTFDPDLKIQQGSKFKLMCGDIEVYGMALHVATIKDKEDWSMALFGYLKAQEKVDWNAFKCVFFD